MTEPTCPSTCPRLESCNRVILPGQECPRNESCPTCGQAVRRLPGQRGCGGMHIHLRPHEDGTSGDRLHHHHDALCKVYEGAALDGVREIVAEIKQWDALSKNCGENDRNRLAYGHLSGEQAAYKAILNLIRCRFPEVDA